MLRNLLKEPGFLVVPGAYDCLTARCAEAAGFKAVFMSGGAIRDAVLGEPDIGIATATEVVNIVRYMANSVNIPLIVDADDGFGATLAAYHTTQEVIRTGAAGIFISDRKPFILATVVHNLVEVLPRDEYLGKIGAVLEARNKEDKDFVIVARIDAGATLGDEEVLARAKACVRLGVDVILPIGIPPESKFGERNRETLRQLFKAIGAPEVKIWGHGGPRDFTAKNYEEVGAKMWVTGIANGVAAKAVLDFYQRFHDTGALPLVSPPEGPNADRLGKLRGLDFWGEVEKKYMLK
jgi:methylisocitrate lyase